MNRECENHEACSCGTCCRQETEEEEETYQPFFLAAGGVCYLLASVFLHFGLPPAVPALCFAAAAALSGWRVFLQGIRAAAKLRLDETVLMTVAVLAAFFLGAFSEAAMVTLLFELGEILQDRAVARSRENIRNLTDIRPQTARVLRGGEKSVPAAEVTIGESIRILPFERIPLDGVVEDGISSLDTSALTGESVPREAAPGSEVLSGMVNGSGVLTVRVTADFQNSAASRIIALVESAAARKGNAEKLITRFAEIYTPVVVGAAVLLAAVPPLLGFGIFSVWMYRALIFLVASCPCALVISIPLGFYAGIGAESRGGVLVKGGRFLEALAEARAVVFDKTGTLTQGKLSVSSIYPANGFTEEEILLLAAGAEQNSVHPAAAAILAAAPTDRVPQAVGAAETPGLGIGAAVLGRQVLCGRRAFLESHGVTFPPESPPSSVFLAVDGAFAGSFLLEDLPRPDAARTVEQMKQLGFSHIVMLTGDAEPAAAAAAEACGISEYMAGLLPEDKVNQIERIRSRSGKTIFLGDGVNDAPVLAASDCGAAMGLGTDAAIEAADIVLVSGNPSVLPAAVTLARRSMRIIRFNIWFALLAKAAVLVLAAFGLAAIWMAVFADVGVCLLSVLNSMRILHFQSSRQSKAKAP